MKCIIISGKAGHGKDTFANFLKEELEKRNKRVITIHYGDAVKWILRDYFNWDGNKDEAGRHLLQYIGTDVVRKNLPDYWTGIVAGVLTAFDNEDLFDVALIPDARFENEVEITMEVIPDSICIRVRRENEEEVEWINPALTEEQRQHPSEISLDNYVFDYIVHNCGNLEMLHDSAIAMLDDIGIEKEYKGE